MVEPSKYPTSCPKCKNQYDGCRVPLELPCGHSFCDECLSTYHKTENKFLCFSDDNKTYELNFKDLSIPYFYLLIVKQLNETPNKSYMCSTHKDEPLKFICEEHNEFLCSLCLWDHAKHVDSTKIYLEEELIKDIQKVELKLSEMNKILDDLKERLHNIRIKKIFQSAEIKTFFADAEKLLVQPFCKTICEEKKSFPLIVGSIAPPNKVFFTESAFLNQAPNKEYLVTIFDGQGLDQTKLLFRGTRDGFKSTDFHKMCDNKGPTLVLVKTKNGYYFGGFTVSTWEHSGGYRSDPGSFIFSLNNKTKQDCNKTTHSIRCDSTYGPTFGGGHDFYIDSDCNQNTNSYSEFGHSYKSPYQYNTVQSKNYLAGSYNFQVDDYEVLL